MSVTLQTTSLYSGQGFNVQDMVNQILDSKRGQETQWKNQQTTLQNQSTALNQLETQVASLYTDSCSLSDFSGVLANKTASCSDPGVLVATATSAAETANHVLQVQSLAAAGVAYSDPIAANTTLDPGSITIQVGDSSRSVDVGTTNTSLSALAAAINKLGLNVTASVQTDSLGDRLTVLSNVAGQAGSVQVTGGNDQFSFTTIAGQDAVVNVDGKPYDSTSNTISGAIPGVTLNLSSSAPGTNITLSVAPDATSVASALNSFVSDYNSIITSIGSQFTYNASTGSAGVLAGDSSLRLLQQSLLSLATYSMSGNGNINTLADLGVAMQDDGTLTVNSSTLNTALTSNFADLQTFFQGTGSFGETLTNTMMSLNNPVSGPLALDLSSIQQTNQDLTNQINDFEANLATQQQQLTDEYSRINSELQELPLLQSQVSQELGSLDPYLSSNTSSGTSTS